MTAHKTLTTLGLALALAMAAEGASAGVAFCVTSGGNLNIQALTGTEVGVLTVSPPLPASNPTWIYAADNYYQKGAGPEWRQSIPNNLPLNSTMGTGCFEIVGISKDTGPNGSSPWYCDYPTVSTTTSGIEMMFTRQQSGAGTTVVTYSGGYNNLSVDLDQYYCTGYRK